MSTVITRLYESSARTVEVISRLKRKGFVDRDIDVIAAVPGEEEGAPGEGAESIVARMEEAGVLKKSAVKYADRVKDGAALLVVRAPFGTVNKATKVADSFQPVRAGVDNEEVYVVKDTVPTNIIRTGAPAPLVKSDEKFMSGGVVPGLMESGTFSAMIGIPTVTEARKRDSVIRKNTTPFSSLLGLSTVIRKKGKLSVIHRNTTPFSSLFGFPTVIRK